MSWAGGWATPPARRIAKRKAAKAPKKPVLPLERQIHLGICKLLELNARPGIVWFHPENERRCTPRQGAYRKLMGVRSGVPDLIFITPWGACFLEIKRPGGKLTELQKCFRGRVEVMGCSYGIETSTDEAAAILKGWNIIPSHRAAAA
jgi:hypothetical protein